MNWIDLTNGPRGVRSIPALAIGPLKLETPHTCVRGIRRGAIVILARQIVSSRLGLQLRALSRKTSLPRRCREFSIPCQGSSARAQRRVGGSRRLLYAHYMRFVHPEMFTLRTVDIVFDDGDVWRLSVSDRNGDRDRGPPDRRRIPQAVRRIPYDRLWTHPDAGNDVFPKGILTLGPVWHRWFSRSRRRTPEVCTMLLVDSVSLSFRGLRALDGVSLSIGSSEMVGITSGLTDPAKARSSMSPTRHLPRRRRRRSSRRKVDRGSRSTDIVGLGLARTFQNKRCSAALAVLENVMVATFRIEERECLRRYFRPSESRSGSASSEARSDLAEDGGAFGCSRKFGARSSSSALKIASKKSRARWLPSRAASSGRPQPAASTLRAA